MVLIGDALHSAHFSIGSGTRLAIEDAIALTKALEAETDIPAALARYQAERKPIVKKLVTAARTSADWYEHFPEHMKLDLMDFAYSYITRSGRIDDARLRAMSPAFMARYEAAKKSGSQAMTHEIADQVPARQSRRARDRVCDSGTLQRQPHPVRQSRARPRRPAGADRARPARAPMRELCAEACAMGPRLSVARA